MFSAFLTKCVFYVLHTLIRLFVLPFWQKSAILYCLLPAFAKIIKTSRFVFFNIAA